MRKQNTWTMAPVEKAWSLSDRGLPDNPETFRKKIFASGNAIERHCKSQHGGKFDPNCPACVEIRQKMYGLKHPA